MGEDQRAVVPFANIVNNILHSTFCNVELYINNHQIYNSNGLSAHKTCPSKKFKGATSGKKGSLHCDGYDKENFPAFGSAFAQIFFASQMKLLSRPDGFFLYGKLGVDFFANSEKLYPEMKNN